MTAQPSIREILSSIQSTEDKDQAFIVAATINLYSEANRRLHGRVLFSPSDVRNVLSILQILFEEPPIEAPNLEGRSRELTPEEAAKVMAGIERAVE
jgi:hypothetical protein